MAGKRCTGAISNNGPGLRESKAFCEGRLYRSLGTSVQQPITDNPHAPNSKAGDAWDLGWGDADAAAGSYLGPTACCAAIGDVVA